MSQRSGGLGRGLGALLPQMGPTSSVTQAPVTPTTPVQQETVAGAYFAEIDITSVVANAKQPRSHFDDEALAELVQSIREVGVLQPVVVRELGDGRHELVMGERRLRASRLAGLTEIPAIVRQTADDDMLRDALLENLHRQQLNPLEEAAAYAQLLADFGATHVELAQRIGRSRPQISNTLRLLQLPPVVQRRVAAGVLSAGHARALLGLADDAAQDALATRIVAEGLSVRAVEEIVATAHHDRPARAPKAPRAQDTGLAEVATRLSDRFETPVKVEMGRGKGRITIEFGGQDDLGRILGVLGDDARG